MKVVFDFDGKSNTSVLACLPVDAEEPPLMREMMLQKMSRAFGSEIIGRDVPKDYVGHRLGHPAYWSHVRASVPEHESDLRRLRLMDGKLMRFARELWMPEDEGSELYKRHRTVVWASERWFKAMQRGLEQNILAVSKGDHRDAARACRCGGVRLARRLTRRYTCGQHGEGEGKGKGEEEREGAASR